MLKQTSENSNIRFWPTSSFKIPIDHNRGQNWLLPFSSKINSIILSFPN